jgi:hypothetical protein
LTGAAVPVPGWWDPKDKRRQRLRALIGRHVRGEDMIWGSFGPAALTYFLKRRNLAGCALPVETFYPFSWDDLSLFFDAPDAISGRLTDKSIGVHLWSHLFQNRRYEPPPVNSWLAVMCERYAISTIN